ncbi:MAG: hypothetical protein IJH37_08260 [Clostridia bacterium]|nr:hypothetical protein [Clostridia bacterium]
MILKLRRVKSHDFIRIFAEESDFLKNGSNAAVKILRMRILPILGMIIVFITSISVLYLGEPVGLSDNGDFRRVLITNNIEYINDTDCHYLFKENYRMILPNGAGVPEAIGAAWRTRNEEVYRSPHFLIIKLSKEINIIANAISGKPLSNYDIKYMAFIYCFMLSLAAGVIFTFFSDNKLRVQVAVFVLFIFIFCDAGYLLYFNSFYGEPLQYTALMMLVAFGMLIYKRPSVPKVIGFFVSLYFFAGAKLANIPYSMIVALLSILIVMMRRDIRFRLAVVLSALVCVISIVGLYMSIPDWMSRDTTYQAVFFGITKSGDDPAADLRELGVDEKYAVLSGTNAYMDGDEHPIDLATDEFAESFYNRVEKTDIAFFYLRHPLRFIKELCMAIENSAYIRPPSVGNSRTVLMELTERFSVWSRLRVTLRFLYEPWVIFAAFMIITGYMIFINIFYIHNHRIESPEKKYMICALDILILGLWINLVLPILTNGEADLAKHMFLFVNCIDILFMVCTVAAVTLPVRQMLKAVAAAAILTGLFYIHLPQTTIDFGTLGGRTLKWNITKRYEDGTMLIVSKKCVAYMPFDETTNNWESSELRAWLNSAFLTEFTDEEKARIELTDNLIPLTYSSRMRAESGDHAHYWNYTRSLVNDLADTSYRVNVTDRVFLPTLDMMEQQVPGETYWILCPYTSNDSMQRFMNYDGFILHTDTAKEMGVKAVMRIRVK